MPYARIPDELCASDQYLEVLDLAPVAGSLVLMGYSYAAREASDGFVPDRWLKRWIDDRETRDAALAALVKVGLWRRDDDGYTMLDYLHAKRNMTRNEWAAKQEADRVRQAAHRAKKVAERESQRTASQRDADVTADVTEPVTNALVTQDVTPPVTDTSQAALSRERAPAPAQTQIQTQTQRTTAANAAAAPRARAHEADSGGGGDVQPLAPHPDLTHARTALVAAGFSGEAIDEDRERTKINRSLTDHPRRIQDWPALGTWLDAERAAGRCRALNPAAGLRYALNSHTQAGMRKAARAPTGGTGRGTAAHAPRVNGSLDLPQPDQGAADAWRELRETYTDAIGDQANQTLLAAIHPLRIDGTVLEVTAQPSGAGYVETQLLPSLRRVASTGNTDVRWIDPTTATTRQEIAA